jgi:hypothetical protein
MHGCMTKKCKAMKTFDILCYLYRTFLIIYILCRQMYTVLCYLTQFLLLNEVTDQLMHTKTTFYVALLLKLYPYSWSVT